MNVDQQTIPVTSNIPYSNVMAIIPVTRVPRFPCDWMVLIFHYGRIHRDDFSGLMIWIGLSSVLRPRQHSI